jgi:hypothetical protein
VTTHPTDPTDEPEVLGAYRSAHELKLNTIRAMVGKCDKFKQTKEAGVSISGGNLCLCMAFLPDGNICQLKKALEDEKSKVHMLASIWSM